MMTDNNQQTAVFVNEQVQKELNTPLKLTKLIDEEEMALLERIVGLINEGKIVLWKPDCLINHTVYDKLTAQQQGKIDLEAVNMLAAIRDIKGLYDSGNIETYQMNNLVERLIATKERIEDEGGDIFII